VIKHNRYIGGGFSFFDLSKLTPDDIFFVTLPIYHSNAGIIGIGAALISGATCVIRKKFSATNFWKDCIKYECTSFSYVGEVCRYLLNQPASDLDRKHKVRIAIGNGMRENVQREFHKRFGVKAIEIYGATEGNCVLGIYLFGGILCDHQKNEILIVMLLI
jgi:acyl-CoA synthetase (AMP-forming)/AMP-acid ligase II